MALRFADFLIDPETHLLMRGTSSIKVEPQVFDLILLLARNAGKVVSRDTIIDEIWQGRIVSEATISGRIAAARRALGDTGARQEVIETVHKVGLRFLPTVDVISKDTSNRAAPEIRQVVRYTTSTDGMTLAWAQHGSGPPILRGGHWLSHLDRDWHSPIWRPFLDALSQRFTVTRYDPRGTGMSQRDIRDFQLAQLADDLLSVADAAGLDRFPIFAASQAVPVAIKVAHDHPDRVSALIFLGGYVRGRHLRSSEEERAREDLQLNLIREGWGKAGTPFLNAFSTVYMPTATPEQIANLVETQRASADVDTALALRHAVDRFDVTDLLAGIKAPTAIIHAAGDPVHPLRQGQQLAAGIAGAEFHLVDGDSHVLLPQDPAWEIVLSTIERLALPT